MPKGYPKYKYKHAARKDEAKVEEPVDDADPKPKQHTPIVPGGVYHRVDGVVGEEFCVLFAVERSGRKVEGLLHSQIYGLTRVRYGDSLNGWEYVGGGVDITEHVAALAAK